MRAVAVPTAAFLVLAAGLHLADQQGLTRAEGIPEAALPDFVADLRAETATWDDVLRASCTPAAGAWIRNWTTPAIGNPPHAVCGVPAAKLSIHPVQDEGGQLRHLLVVRGVSVLAAPVRVGLIWVPERGLAEETPPVLQSSALFGLHQEADGPCEPRAGEGRDWVYLRELDAHAPRSLIVWATQEGGNTQAWLARLDPSTGKPAIQALPWRGLGAIEKAVVSCWTAEEVLDGCVIRPCIQWFPQPPAGEPLIKPFNSTAWRQAFPTQH